jgi:pyruvate,water dikinase
MSVRRTSICLVLLLVAAGCDPDRSRVAGDVYTPLDLGAIDFLVPVDQACEIPEGEIPQYTTRLGCAADFDVLASRPLDASIPGARSSKTVIDREGGDAVYFLHAETYPIHYYFCQDHLSGGDLPPVTTLGEFNATEYYSQYRRFLLGSLTRYDDPGIWVYELAPYDTANADMIVAAYDRLREESFLGEALYFHPTSEMHERLVPELPAHVNVVTGAQLFEGVSFLPLNLGVTMGRLRFFSVDALEAGEAFVTPRDVAVLDRVPNDISVVAGIITDALQTPLSHINVLSQNRGTPNMSLVGAMHDEAFRALEGQWVRLTVEAFSYSIEAVDAADAELWWESHKPPPIPVPALDLSVTDLRDIQELTPADIPAFGGKASNYGVLASIGDPVPVPPGFGIPVYWSREFERINGLDARIETMLADPVFIDDIAYREAALEELRREILQGTVPGELMQRLRTRLEKDFPGQRMRFRSSTNAEDLAGFTGAGLYTSQTGALDDPERTVEDALRLTWSSLWNFRAFEERTWRGIPHRGVAMATLVHRSFPDEDANGVALTANIFDTTGVEPAFYINVQAGGVSVVRPPPGVTTDQLQYFFFYPNQPTVFLGHSNLVPPDENVLTRPQTYALGKALDAIHVAFQPWYQDPNAFYAMDVEFKFDTSPGDVEPRLWVKQARPHPGWAVGLGE